MIRHLCIIAALAGLSACQSTATPDPGRPAGPRAADEDRDLRKALLEAEFRTLLEVQDSYRMMLTMASSTTFGDRELIWTEEQSRKGDQLSVDIIGLLSRYTMEITVRANDPVPMDPVLFGREVEKLGERRSALWLSLVESNGLPDSARSIFHHGMYPAR